MNILNSTWAFKFKRILDSNIQNFKAMILWIVNEQVYGIDNLDNLAPVNSLTKLRIVLVLPVIIGLDEKQSQYT